jgi:hypothetical protein
LIDGKHQLVVWAVAIGSWGLADNKYFFGSWAKRQDQKYFRET